MKKGPEGPEFVWSAVADMERAQMPRPAVAKEPMRPRPRRNMGAMRSKAASMREKVMVVSVSSSVWDPGERAVRLDTV